MRGNTLPNIEVPKERGEKRTYRIANGGNILDPESTQIWNTFPSSFEAGQQRMIGKWS